MEIEIGSKRNNSLLNRTEVYFIIRHNGEGTPAREIIRSELAGKLNVKKENIVVDNIHSGFGIRESTGYAKIYKSVEAAKDRERDHILERNKIIERKEKKKEEKKPAEKPEKKPEAEGEPEKEEEKPEKEEKPVEEPLKEEGGEPVEKTEEKPEEQPAEEEQQVEPSKEDKRESEKQEEKPAEEKKE